MSGKRVAAVLSGGNVDRDVYREVLVRWRLTSVAFCSGEKLSPRCGFLPRLRFDVFGVQSASGTTICTHIEVEKRVDTWIMRRN